MNSGLLLYTIVLGIIGGIASAVLGLAGSSSALVLLGAAIVLLAYSFFKRHTALLIAVAACASIAFGIVRTDAVLAMYESSTLPKFFDTPVEIRGAVANDPEERDAGVRAMVAVSEIDGVAAQGRVLATVPRGTVLKYGDRISLDGVLREPESFVTDAGREFDYPQYLAAQHIQALMSRASVGSREAGGVSLTGQLYMLRHSFESSLNRTLPEPHNALMKGLLLGQKSSMPEYLERAFVQASLVHIVVLSGYNIAIVASATLRVFGAVLPSVFALGAGGITITLFALMVGGGEATVRALIMALIAIVARYLGRSTLALRSLAVASAAMALWNPLAAVYSPSLILSVLATFGLITISPWVEQKIASWKFLDALPRLKLREIAASTIAVQLFVMPALLYYTGIFSVVALPANLLALPVVSYAMFAGFVAGIVGYVFQPLGIIAAIPTYGLLQWIISIATIASSLPLSTVSIPAFPAWLTACIYVPLTWFAITKYVHTTDARKDHDKGAGFETGLTATPLS